MKKADSAYSDTQQKILASALTLIAKNGFKATTTKQIAQKSGYNESTLFKNFANKAKLFAAIKASETKLLEEKLEHVLNQNNNSLELFIQHNVKAIYQVFLQHRAYITITLRELDNETLNIGENSIFEYITNAFSLRLSKIMNAESTKYNTIVFMLVSSLMVMVVNQANHHVLTDDLQAPIHIEQISDFTYSMIKNIK